jgi:putative transposase
VDGHRRPRDRRRGYIDWFNHRRLHGEIGLIPPAEHEDDFYRHNTAAATVAASVPSLH